MSTFRNGSAILAIGGFCTLCCGRQSEPAMQPASGTLAPTRSEERASAAKPSDSRFLRTMYTSHGKGTPNTLEAEALVVSVPVEAPAAVESPTKGKADGVRGLTRALARAGPTSSEAKLGLEQASARINRQRCKREARCNRVGIDGTHGMLAGCERGLSPDTRGTLDPDCRVGVAPFKLETCLEAIRVASCRSTIDTLDRIAVCRPQQLCGE